jgi:hypothetical protein
MLKYQLFTLYVFFHTALCGCRQDSKRAEFKPAGNDYTITRIGKMNREDLTESSGLAWTDGGNLWTHGDAGSPGKLYKVSKSGQLLATQPVPRTSNEDWEDLAKDKSGNLYIGDFGNNRNKRQNLRIFKVRFGDTIQVDTIRFSYADQKLFPPKKNDRNFDCEAFFWHDHNLYLFSKDRGREEWVKVYKVPEKPGDYSVKPIDSLQMNTMITAADISPDEKHFALLGYGKIYLFETPTGEKIFDGQKYCIPVGKSGQAEALVFENNNDLVFSNENGKIFRVKKK